MIQILNEITVDLGLPSGEVVSFWHVAYREIPECKKLLAAKVIQGFGNYCLSQGWEFNCADDPNQEDSLNFCSEEDDDDDLYDLRHWL